MKPKILVIVGTVRENRVGRKIANWYVAEAKKRDDIELELLDIAELNLPVFSEPVSPMRHEYSETQQKLAKIVGAADGYVFVTGEYNHSIPGSLKNFLDYLYAEWNHKVAAYVGYGSVGGVRGVEHLIQIMTELKSASIPNNVFIRLIWQALDDKGVPKPEYVFGDINQQLDELKWWADALKAARK